MFIVRTNGPTDALLWSGTGGNSIGIYSLPRLQPIRVKDVTVRLPSADGSGHRKNIGSTNETANLKTKPIKEILGDIRRVFNSMTFLEFESLAEAQSFIATGKTDLELIGVDASTPQSDVRKAFLKVIAAAHPDKKSGNNELAQHLNAAYERIQKKAVK